MIYSDSDDTTKLPIQYIPVHDYCCNLLMDIVPFLTDKKYKELTSLSFNFDKKHLSKIKNFSTGQLIDWLKSNGYEKEYEKFLIVSIFKGILADFVEYIEFSLISSRRSRLNVALNLIRKPFLENLIVLEQILSKPEELISAFTEKEPEKYDPSSEKDKLGLIHECIKNTGNNIFFKADIIYALRFDKNNPNSYYAISNQAVHLVTTRNKAYETEKQNFNLIFTPETNYKELWSCYYDFIPLLLYYAVEIIETIANRETKQPKEEFLFRKFSRLIGYLFITEILYPRHAIKDSALDKFSGKFLVYCPSCKKENVIFKSDFHDIYSNNILCCKHCLIDMLYDKKILSELLESFFN
jgi:hypothetical protein